MISLYAVDYVTFKKQSAYNFRREVISSYYSFTYDTDLKYKVCVVYTSVLLTPLPLYFISH